MSETAERFGATHAHRRRRCSECGHFTSVPSVAEVYD